MNITIDIPEGAKKKEWNIPFNDIVPSEANAIFLYIKNESEQDIYLDAISIASSRDIVNIQIHSVIGEPVFTRPDDIKPSSKVLGRNSVTPELVIVSCAKADDLGSIGQLDRLDMREQHTTYKTKLGITIPQESSIAITSSDGDLKLSGILAISEKEIIEE